MVRRILFARSADANNVNAQAKNAQYILRHWQSREYRPSVFASSPPDPGVAGNPNVDIIHLRNNRLWRADLFAAYLGRFDAIFYPGIHEWVDWLALHTRALSGRRLPLIATVEGLAGELGNDVRERRFAANVGHPVYGQKMPGPRLRRYEALRDMADHIIAISPFLGRQATAHWGAKVSVLPLGVDTSLFCREAWKRHRRPRVVCAGNVRAHKRPEMFIELASRFPQADFVWFGEGDLRRSLLAQAERAGATNLSFPGALSTESLAQEFRTSDILVLPSLSEGVPKVTQEAAAAGLAQIVFGFYEAPSVIDGRNGFVVWNDRDLVARLEQLLGSPATVEKLGRAGMNLARQWSWDIVARRWERQIVDVLEGRAVAEKF